MTAEGVRARWRAIHAARCESELAGRDGENRLLQDIIKFTIRRDAGWVADQQGDSLEVLWAAYEAGAGR